MTRPTEDELAFWEAEREQARKADNLVALFMVVGSVLGFLLATALLIGWLVFVWA